MRRSLMLSLARQIPEADASNYIMLVGARYALHCSKPLALAMGYRACPIDDMLVFNIVSVALPKIGDERKLVPPVKINPRIPASLNELIIASLSLDPAKRPAGMFELRDQLSAIAKQMGLAEVDLRGADEE